MTHYLLTTLSGMAKNQQWDGKLPLVVGEGGTPFIAIPTQ